MWQESKLSPIPQSPLTIRQSPRSNMFPSPPTHDPRILTPRTPGINYGQSPRQTAAASARSQSHAPTTPLIKVSSVDDDNDNDALSSPPSPFPQHQFRSSPLASPLASPRLNVAGVGSSSGRLATAATATTGSASANANASASASVSGTRRSPPSPPSAVLATPRPRVVNANNSPGPERRRSILNRASQAIRRSLHGTPSATVRFLHPEDGLTTKYMHGSPRVRKKDLEEREKRASWRASRSSYGGMMSIRDYPNSSYMEEDDEEDSSQTHDRDREERREARRKKREERLKNDPLSILERRRRRDFTIGSRPALAPPPPSMVIDPNTNRPIEPEEENKFSSNTFIRMWQRIWDMPFMSEPIVATLVIPQPLAKEVPESWYKPRGWSDWQEEQSEEYHHPGFSFRPNPEMELTESPQPDSHPHLLQMPSPAYSGIWKGRRQDDTASWRYAGSIR